MSRTEPISMLALCHEAARGRAGLAHSLSHASVTISSLLEPESLTGT